MTSCPFCDRHTWHGYEGEVLKCLECGQNDPRQLDDSAVKLVRPPETIGAEINLDSWKAGRCPACGGMKLAGPIRLRSRRNYFTKQFHCEDCKRCIDTDEPWD